MSQPHVLFIEDEEYIRVIMTEILVGAGFKVTEADNAETALSLLEEQCRFDLLLTDVHMPGRFNGIDVASHVRLLWPEIPVVFVTGRPEILDTFKTSGPRPRCVSKPYVPRDVLAAIRSSFAHDAQSERSRG